MPDSMAVQHKKRINADEQTPLLTDSSGISSPPDVLANNVQTEGDEDEAPLPTLQLWLLCYVRTVEPMVFFGIFPFVQEMVRDSGNLDEADVGFYTGLIESLFSLTQMVVMIFWGRMSDRVGRKPVLVISLFGISITASLFGFSRTIWQMVLFRCLAGIFAGSIVTVRTMMSELSTAKTRAKVFSYFAFAGNIALFLGPLIGGALAQPAKQYGGIFADIQFFKSFPYAFATLVTGGIVLSAAIITVFFIGETKPPSKSPTSQTGDETEANLTSQGQPIPQSTWQILKYPGVTTVLYIYGFSMLLGVAYTAVAPIYWFTPPALGGTGFTPLMISFYMALIGFSQAIWLLIVFPRLHKRYGTGGILNICGTVYPFMFLQFPVFNTLLRLHKEPATIIFWVLSPVLTAASVGVSMVFTAVQLAINDISPAPETLGTLNALALTLNSGLRAVGPWSFTSIFAIGAKTQILGGYLIWVVFVAISTIYAFSVRWLPVEAGGTAKKQR